MNDVMDQLNFLHVVAESSCHSDTAPAVNSETHRTGRVSGLFHESRYNNIIIDDFVELFKINKPDISTSFMSAMHCK